MDRHSFFLEKTKHIKLEALDWANDGMALWMKKGSEM